MPEFILDLGSPDGARTYRQLDAFTQGYIEAAFFTDASDPDDGDLEYATFADIAPASLERIKADCAAFQSAAADLLDQAYERDDYSPEQAGRDYWFTRNGHGVGFWDRKQLNAGDLGDLLSARCGRTEINLCRGDDGMVHFE